MEEVFVMMVMIASFLMGASVVGVYYMIRVRALCRAVDNLRFALHAAGNTICEQSEEINNILRHAKQCESELIN